jgi:hypothetical protein
VALLAVGKRLHILAIELGLVAAIRLQRIFGDAETACDFLHWLLDCAPRDLDVRHTHSQARHFREATLARRTYRANRREQEVPG